MCAALGIIDIIAESKHIFMKLIDILQGDFYRNSLGLSLIVDHVMNRFLGFIHVLDKADDSLRLMVLDMLCFLFAPVFIDDRQFRIQICGLMETALDFIFFKSRPVKDRVVRQKINGSTGLSGLTHHRQEPFIQFHRRNTPFVMVFVDKTACLDRHMHMTRQRINHRRTDTMQSTAGLIRLIIEFSPCVKRRKYESFRADSFFMHTYRNTPPVIRHRCRTVRLKRHADRRAESCQMLVHRIIHDLIDQMVQPFRGNAADIHAGSYTNRLKTLQHGNTGCIIIICCICLRHCLTPHIFDLRDFPRKKNILSEFSRIIF